MKWKQKKNLFNWVKALSIDIVQGFTTYEYTRSNFHLWIRWIIIVVLFLIEKHCDPHTNLYRWEFIFKAHNTTNKKKRKPQLRIYPKYIEKWAKNKNGIQQTILHFLFYCIWFRFIIFFLCFTGFYIFFLCWIHESIDIMYVICRYTVNFISFSNSFGLVLNIKI